MPTNLLNLDQARVANPILTDVARGYQNAPLIADKLFPRVPVKSRAGQVIQFGKDAFRIRNTKRGPGEPVARINVNYGSTGFKLEQHALGVTVPVEHTEEARVMADMELLDESIMTTVSDVRLEIENEAAVLATTAGNYAAGNKVALTSTDRWDTTTGDPFAQVAAGREAVRQKIGRRPNVMIIGAKVLTMAQCNGKILDRLKYTSSAVPTLADLARLFQVDEVVEGGAVAAGDDDVFTDIWGNNIILAYVALGSKTRREPSYGYNYELKGSPIVTSPEFNKQNRSFEAEYIYEHGLYLVGAEGGYLMQTVVS